MLQAHGLLQDGFHFESGPSLYSGMASTGRSANPLAHVLQAIDEVRHATAHRTAHSIAHCKGMYALPPMHIQKAPLLCSLHGFLEQCRVRGLLPSVRIPATGINVVSCAK